MYVVYLSFAGSIGHSLNDNHAEHCKQKKEADRKRVVLEEFLSNRELFCT